MTFGNEYPNIQTYPSAYPYFPRSTPYPYSHYYHLVRSDSSSSAQPSDSQSATQELISGHMNAGVGSGQGIHVDTAGEVGGQHGIGLNAGGNVDYGGAGMHAGGHIGSPSYGIQAQGNTHLNNSQGLGLSAEAQALGKYGVAAQAKTQVGGGQGAGFHTGAQAGGTYGLSADAEGHLGFSQGAGLQTHLQLGGDNGLGAHAKAQLGGGQGAGLGVGGQVGKYNGQLGFKIGGKDAGAKDSKEPQE
ncbi:hypothetical protein [Paenibacillus sp. P46E]|uniref:hypothetical protein n=1 Tax=Paenibacillus sp. P46E TaxID=1349436 RepID=UPI00093DA7A3|nr:hypothetical protein [Paenibacillus sp. P46E]OKQ00251.1 hypothetical protein A3849_00690 [Paenibacillus sp. P46E]